MYNFILKKDFSNIDTSSLVIKQNEGRLHTDGEADNYLLEMDKENTYLFDKIIKTCHVILYLVNSNRKFSSNNST